MRIRFSVLLMPILFMTVLFLGVQTALASPSFTYHDEAWNGGAGDDYFNVTDPTGTPITLSLSHLSLGGAGKLLFKLQKSGASGQFFDVEGTGYDWNTWIYLPSKLGSGGVDLVNLPSDFVLDVKIRYKDSSGNIQWIQLNNDPGAPDNWATINPENFLYIVWDSNRNHIQDIGSGDRDLTASIAGNQVPVPPSVVLLGSGLVGLVGFGVRRRKS